MTIKNSTALRKRIAISLLLTVYSHLLFSQVTEPRITFGEHNIADLEMKIYPKDSSAEAVVLYDYADYSFSFQYNSPMVEYTFHKRIKILKQSALERGTISIPYRWESTPERQEIIKDIKGITYNIENGSVQLTELTKKSIFEEKSSGNIREMKIIFPQVKEGSVIELSYSISSPLWYFLRTWSFQKDIPVVWSGIKAVIPGYFDYKLTNFGYQPFIIKEVKQGVAIFFSRANERGEEIKDPYLSYYFAMKDLPALKTDDYMTTVEDYRSSIDFELARTFFPSGGERNYSITYKDLTKTLLDDPNYGSALRKFGKTAKKIAADILLKSTSKDTLVLISNAYDYVRNDLNWNGENRLAVNSRLDQVYEKKLGNATEINLILVGVLQEMGFEANPVVLSTRSHGKVLPDIALMDRFNYSIAHMVVKGKDFLLDATDKFVKMNMLPKRCLNERGWLIAKNPKWVSLAPTERKQINSQLFFSIEDEQQLKGQFTETYYGYANAEEKAEINEIGEAKYIENLKAQYAFFEDTEFSLKESENKEARISCKTTVSEAYTVAGERIFIRPLLWKTQKQNPFVQAERQYPVDLGYGIQETVIGKYTIPENYKVESLPTSINVTLPQNKGKYLFIIKADNGVIEVMSQLLLAKSIFTTDEYFDLRELFNRMISKQNEQIVLKKN